jgi:hypothetical protein
LLKETGQKILVSYLEIYNEKVRDLLSDMIEQPVIIDDGTKGVVVQNLKWMEIKSMRNVVDLIDKGNVKRVTAET